MSTPTEFESLARQDFGPTSSTSNLEPLLVHKLAESMSIPSVDVPQAMPSEVHSEPDSTLPSKSEEGLRHSHEDYAVMESETEEVMDPLPEPQATYSIIEKEDSDDGGLRAPPVATSAIVHNVTKMPQSYTLNVDATVSNIATIQSSTCVSSTSQMILLPTILTTGSQPLDTKTNESPAGISQIIITNEPYTDTLNQSSQRTLNNVLTDTNFLSRPKSSKVQILSNISLPKSTAVLNYSPFVNTETSLYNSSDNVYQINSGSGALNSKHLNHSVINKTPKTPASVNYPNMTSTVISQAHLKTVGYTHNFPKGTNSKTTNKVNSSTNTNPVPVVPPGSMSHCHILSRVVSGPKLAVQPGRKAPNAFNKNVKNSISTNSSTKQSRSIKIIQQTGTNSKTEMKGWSINSNSKVNQSYNVDTNSKTASKSSPTHKSQMLIPSKPVKSEQRVILQSPCGPALVSTAPMSLSHHRPSHYVQAGSQNLHYVHNYIQTESEVILPSPSPNHQISANQHLTAQILQSLSQPLAAVPIRVQAVPEPYSSIKPVQPRRHPSGDTPLLTTEEIISMEDKPNLTSEETINYSHDNLALVMLDHTYALSAQKLSPVPVSSPTVIATAPRAPSPAPVPLATPASPVKSSPPPVGTSIQSIDYQMDTSVAPPLLSSPVVNAHPMSFPYECSLVKRAAIDDDAASGISSADEHEPNRGGSDTETAPEVDDGKTRCICDFTHDDGYMICCDRCGEWQHVDCMGIDRNDIPDAYQCSECQPRKVERRLARALQARKRQEFGYRGSGSESSDTGQPGPRRKRLLTVTTYSDTSGASVTPFGGSPAPLVHRPTPHKRLPAKRSKKTDLIRKPTKRKLNEKRAKRKKEMMSRKHNLGSSQGGWHDAYEQAVTNHYSPELRAKIMRYGSKAATSPHLAQAVSAHHCATVPHAGGKILVATRDLHENTPIIELRGKYMLSTQHRPQVQMSSRAGGQKPGPFVFFYRLPKDNTQVCIDTRTYGNEARFVRRSCKYNAELQHCVVKGTLHVYIVSLGFILDGTEITVPHDHASGKQPCACNNPKHCKLNGFNTVAARKAPVDYPSRERKSRNRCSSSSSPGSPQDFPNVPPQRRLSVINTNIKSPVKSGAGSPLKTWGTAFTEAPISDSIFEEEKVDAEVDTKPVKKEEPVEKLEEVIKQEIKEDVPEVTKTLETVSEVKMEVEEHKVEVTEKIMSPKKEIKEEIKEEVFTAFEAENIPLPEGPPPAVKEEEKEKEKPSRARHERTTRSSRSSAANHDSMDEKTDDSQDKPTETKDKKKMTREERKMEAIMRAFERMEKAEQRKQEVKERQSKRRESDPVPPSNADKDEDEEHCTPAKKRRQRKGRARTTSTNTSRRRLNSADSDMVTSGDEAPTLTSPRRSQSSPRAQDINVSSACLLVEAAVGPLESAFKLPKTKKTMANEWLGRSPEHNTFQPTFNTLERLVEVASNMIGDLGGNSSEHDDGSPPHAKNRPPKKMKRGTNKVVTVPETPVIPVTQHSAKKRWLRQAISEESDSPTAESPPNEMVTPLKKRRLARESLSLDTPVVKKPEEVSPPVTCSEDSPTKDEVRDSITRHCKMKSRYIDSIYGSDFAGGGQTLDPQNVFLNLKDPRDEKFNLDIRRIIGVPGTEETFEDIPLPEERKPIDVNENEFQHNSVEEKTVKAMPMEIDTEISLPPGDPPDRAEKAKSEMKTPVHSNDTSGNSSPQRDYMDDIQKKIHSFHTENIQILKIRNKKPPKEKRKKVNLNFDLNMVDDQISIQLRTDASPKDMNGDIDLEEEPIMLPAPDLIPLPPPVEKSALVNSNPRYIPWMDDIPLPTEPMKTPESISPQKNDSTVCSEVTSPEIRSASPLASSDSTPVTPQKVDAKTNVETPPENEQVAEKITETISETIGEPEIQEQNTPNTEQSTPTKSEATPDSTETEDNMQVTPEKNAESPQDQSQKPYTSTGLFSEIFSNLTTTEPVKLNNLNIVNTINNIEDAVFTDKPSTPGDELRNVQEILDRVNSMDANTSIILSGVLNADVAIKTEGISLVKTYAPRSNDPRLNPPSAEKPKPVRRKLSISEYLKRHKATCAPDSESRGASVEPPGDARDWSSDSASRSPLRSDSNSLDEDVRFHHAKTTLPITRGSGRGGEFDAEPTQLERQREKLSERLRREFGLSLPHDEDARAHADRHDLGESPML